MLPFYNNHTSRLRGRGYYEENHGSRSDVQAGAMQLLQQLELRQNGHLLHLPRDGVANAALSFQLPFYNQNADVPKDQLLQLMIIREQERRIAGQIQYNLSMQYRHQSLLRASQLSPVLDLSRNVAPNDPIHAPAQALMSISMQAPEVAPLKCSSSTKSGVSASKKADHGPAGRSIKPKKTDAKWLATYDRLKAYKKRQGDCIVPRGYALDPALASWVAEQRKQYKLFQDGKASSITPERTKLLQDLNFTWNAQESAWKRRLAELTKFKQLHGHCHVSLSDTDFPKLGLWVKEQRRHYTLLKQGKLSHMSGCRVAELDGLDFCWDTHEATWTERFNELVQRKQQSGGCDIPVNKSDDGKLSTWMNHQRRQYRKFKKGKTCYITKKRVRALESLGIDWYDSGASDRESTSEREPEVGRPRKRSRTNNEDAIA